jgi:hypothetical protein
MELDWSETGPRAQIVAAVVSKHPAILQFPLAARTA